MTACAENSVHNHVTGILIGKQASMTQHIQLCCMSACNVMVVLFNWQYDMFAEKGPCGGLPVGALQQPAGLH